MMYDLGSGFYVDDSTWTIEKTARSGSVIKPSGQIAKPTSVDLAPLNGKVAKLPDEIRVYSKKNSPSLKFVAGGHVLILPDGGESDNISYRLVTNGSSVVAKDDELIDEPHLNPSDPDGFGHVPWIFVLDELARDASARMRANGIR